MGSARGGRCSCRVFPIALTRFEYGSVWSERRLRETSCLTHTGAPVEKGQLFIHISSGAEGEEAGGEGRRLEEGEGSSLGIVVHR